MTGPSQQHTEQAPIDRAIASELIALTPESWISVSLELNKGLETNGAIKIAHRITNPDGRREIVTPDETLYSLTYRLFELMNKYGHDLQTATYTLRQLPDGDWRMQVSYGYGQEHHDPRHGPDGA